MNLINARIQFGSSYKTCVDSIFRYIAIRTSDREVAVDFTQDVFMRYWDALLHETVIKNHRAFLFTIAKNIVIDWYRKKKTLSLEALTEYDTFKQVQGSEPSLFLEEKEVNTVYASAEARYVITKIKELDILYQEVVYLRLVEELFPREISAILGLTVNVVSVRITRGMHKLRSITGYDIHHGEKGTAQKYTGIEE